MPHDVPSNEKMGLSCERWSIVGCPLLDLQASPSQADVVAADRASAQLRRLVTRL